MFTWISHFGYKGKSYFILLGSAVICFVISITLYTQTKGILEDRLKERLISVVSTASLIFNPKDIVSVHSDLDFTSETYKRLVYQLQNIRSKNKNVRFAYLLSPTDKTEIFHFIADADSIDPTASIDLNKDGQFTDEDALATPGDEYDASDAPELRYQAVSYAVTDDKLVVDQWGASLSAYAPIIYNNNAIAVLGIDVDVSDYLALISATFIPFALFIVFLLLLLSFLTVRLLSIWESRVKLLQDLDRQKDELLGMVSHQLAKPITAIKWNLESMIDGDIGNLNSEQKESANTMQSMATSLADLVSMILDVSRIQLGKVKLDPQPLELNAFFKEIVDVVQPTIKERKISFVQEIYPEKLPTVLLDKRYTRMTIENLLTNAIKYTPEGGTVKLWVQVTNNILHCSVSDTGCGIPKVEQEKIFGKMFRASNVRNTMDGNGFGLYVAKGAVEGQGGKIWFQSTEAKGTTFFVDLPAKTAEIKAS